MDEPSTDSLRKLAPCWTLAGDEKLLTILQNAHQRLVVKCQEANSQLEQMASALDDASITLQNVNNQFMALSSSQFIESRVYDDDADVATDAPVAAETPKTSASDELSILKRSIAVIERNHELITILHDSDTESDTDDDVPDRLVMKPKDLYADRLLPYIIGSEPWKNKWHAGLMPEDSDTDSSTSKVDRESDQYSQSEPDEFDPVHPAKGQESSPVPQHVRNLSESSSELPSEATPNTKTSPADVARELARRLGAHPPPKMVDVEPEYEEPSKPAVRKIYKPQEPVTSTIFPESPPPVPQDDASSDEGDIFAELARPRAAQTEPYSRRDVTTDLFGNHDDAGDIFSDFADQPPSMKTSIFDAGPTPHMFDKQMNVSAGNRTATAEPPARTDEHTSKNAVDDEERSFKKPIGGISLFGSNKGAENIGAAIMKRNQRKISTSDESGNEVTESPPPIKEPAKKEKEIFDDLFAKSESKKAKTKEDNIAKDLKQHIQQKTEEKVKKDAPKAVDLFSDNLFDDIDDIFTTNVVKTSKNNKKSIFEDDDDLFSEIAEPKTVKNDSKSGNNIKKGLFDSDDDLFTENVVKNKPSVSAKSYDTITKLSENSTKDNEKSTKGTIAKEITSIFDSDEDNIFSNNKISELNNATKVQNVTVSTGDNNLTNNVETSKSIFKSPSLFDDDDDDSSDLFTESVKSSTNTPKNETVKKGSVDISTKVETIITEEKTELNTEAKIKESDVILNEKPTENKANIIEENIVTGSSIITDEITIENDNSIERESKVLESNAINVGTISQNVESNSDVIIKPAENKPVNNSIQNIKSSTVYKIDEDENDKTLEDDISEQDFDDEPTKTSHSQQNNAPKTTETANIHNIFDNIHLEEDDLFASSSNSYVRKDEFRNTENGETKIENNVEVPKSAIFGDIISEPPDFEKPKEPKKSKNVNALFDDDSDDEALFFKKEDVVFDEKPEDFTIKQDRLFGLFTDEPPEDDLDDNLFSTLPKPKIPDDGVSKSNVESYNSDSTLPNYQPIVKVTNKIESEVPVPETPEMPYSEPKAIFKIPSLDIDTSNQGDTDDTNSFEQSESLIEPQSIRSDDDDEELFKSLPVQLPTQETDSAKNDSDEELFKSLPIYEKPVLSTTELHKSVSNTDIFKVPSTQSEVKKVGKLKFGLNINVNALLPGASPKKVKSADSLDGQTQSSAEIKSDEPIKTVSFDGKPESEVLDNKLSKERPRIQVKRRPSTRKARREAVRKSGIDFGEDSTDNSSSIDEPAKATVDIIKTIDTTQEKEVKQEIRNNLGPKSTELNDNIIDKAVRSETQVENVDKQTKTVVKLPVKSDSTTKIVYILNDEDIFNTNVIEQPEPDLGNAAKNTVEIDSNSAKNNVTGSISNISKVESIDAEVESPIAKNIDTNSKLVKTADSVNLSLGVNTLGRSYKSTENKKASPSLFGDGGSTDDDDELFKNKKPVTKVSIFDSDSEGELFGTAKKERKKVEKVLKVEKVKEVKGSLFGDDDDDDLFGVKTRKTVEPQPQATKAPPSVKEPAKPTQPVFEDPLSMFGGDD